MMVQYLALKEKAADCLLFYRMGDFFELFFDDAKKAAETLDIALTARGNHKGDPIPMCGVPVHDAEVYLLTLIRKGFRVAVGEQLESPAEAKKRGYEVKVGTFPFSANARARIMQEGEGMIKFVSDARYDQVLGLHIIGPKATELIVEGGMALRMEATTEEIIHTIHAHPTLSEALGEAAHAVLGQALHI